MSDVEALDWLDRLLSADEVARDAAMQSLATSNPELHARLARMLSGALSPDTRLIAAPVLAGFARVLDTTRSLTSGDVLAGYRLKRELGQGGMSVVWLAERADGVVKRQVALKMPLFSMLGADAERFARERDALAALTHPHIARLYDAGVTESGQPFIALEYVNGEDLWTTAMLAGWTYVRASACSCRCYRPSSTRISISSCTATSNPRTFSSTPKGR